RYETALNFRNRQRLEHPDAPADAAFNYVLMLLVDVRDPGLTILPTHRLLHDLEGFDAAELLRRLAREQRLVRRSDRASLLAATVLDQVEAGAAQAAFLLRPPAVSDVVAVANAGQVMPQKSTYFYPKPASGIVFNPLDARIRIPALK